MNDVTRAPSRSLVHRGLGTTEFYDLTRAAMSDLGSTLDDLAAEGRTRFSFHAPVIRPDDFPYPAVCQFFLNEDVALRELNFRALDDTLAAARQWDADYVVIHLTYGAEDTRDEALAERLARETCARVAKSSRRYGVPVDVEFAAYTDSFNSPVSFVAAVAPHPELGICIDIGHAFIGAEIRERDYRADVAVLAPLARSLHLWNTRGAEHFRHDPHTPLHPSQRPADGWIDVEGVLTAVMDARPVRNIIFEYPVERVTPEIQEGYDWIADLLSAAPTGAPTCAPTGKTG